MVRLLAASLLLALLLVSGLSATAKAADGPLLAPRLRDGAGSSTNWAGYAVTGGVGSVSDVKASWQVPAVSCAAGETSYSSFWVGIDGFSSRSVEQTGTDSDCRNGVPTYFVWTELYPKPSQVVRSVAVAPGDIVSAEVSYAGGRFTLALADVTTHQSASTSAKVSGAQRSSAEWIAEAPSSSGGVLPLSNFGTAAFGLDHTGVSSTSYATVGGQAGALGSFGSAVQSITMVSGSGAAKAVPSALSADGTSFTVQWASRGP